MSNEETTRLTVTLSRETDLALRAFLGAQGMRKGDHISWMKSSRSAFRPSSNFLCFVAASTASTHLAGAGKFLAIPLTMLRANWK